MKVYDLTGATLYDPDADPHSEVRMRRTSDRKETSMAVPSYAYDRRIRVVSVRREGVTVSRRRLDMRTLTSCLGMPPYTSVSGTAESGQECMILSGSDGHLIMGADYTSVTRRSLRGMTRTIDENGRLEVLI